MEHLKGMGESTACFHRQYNVGLETMLGMSSIYQRMYMTLRCITVFLGVCMLNVRPFCYCVWCVDSHGLEDGTIPATFQVRINK